MKAVNSSLDQISKISTHPMIILGALFGASKLDRYDELSFKMTTDLSAWWSDFSGGDVSFTDYVDGDGNLFWDAWRDNLKISELSQFISLPGVNESTANAIENSFTI